MVTLAPAYDDPHMITCHMVENPSIQEFARQAMWEQWDAAAAKVEAEEGDVVPDEATLHEWAQAAMAKTWSTAKRRAITLTTLKGWWANPERWTPWLDDIAIARALRFDWGVIERLTMAERREFIAALVVEGWTPPGATIQPSRTRGASGHFTGEMAGPQDSEGMFSNQRDADWRKGSKAQRDRVRKDMYDLRKAQRGCAVA